MSVEICQQKFSKLKHREKKGMKKVREIWDNVEQSNVYVIGVPEERGGRKEGAGGEREKEWVRITIWKDTS